MTVCNRLREFLDSHHIKYSVLAHSQAFTAQEVAQRMHIPGREMAKTVVVKTPHSLALVVVRAPDRVDMDLVSAVLGTDARLATEQEFSDAFPDCELGAMPPFGNLYDIPTLVDEELSKDEEIFFNAGTHTEAIRMKLSDLRTLAKPKVARLAISLSGMAQ